MQKCRSDAIPSATFRLGFHLYGEQAQRWCFASCRFLTNPPPPPSSWVMFLEAGKKKAPDLIVLPAEEKKLQYELPCCPTPVSDSRCNLLMEKDLLRVWCLLAEKSLLSHSLVQIFFPFKEKTLPAFPPFNILQMFLSGICFPLELLQ